MTKGRNLIGKSVSSAKRSRKQSPMKADSIDTNNGDNNKLLVINQPDLNNHRHTPPYHTPPPSHYPFTQESVQNQKNNCDKHSGIHGAARHLNFHTEGTSPRKNTQATDKKGNKNPTTVSFFESQVTPSYLCPTTKPYWKMTRPNKGFSYTMELIPKRQFMIRYGIKLYLQPSDNTKDELHKA